MTWFSTRLFLSSFSIRDKSGYNPPDGEGGINRTRPTDIAIRSVIKKIFKII